MMIMVVSILEVVGSQRRRHTQPATDRPVQGTTPSRRRVAPDRPIGGGKGGRRLCGRIPGSAVSLCKRRCKNTREQHRPNQNQKTTEQKTRTETPPRDQTPTTTQRERRRGKKEKVRERDLDVGVVLEVRVVEGDRGRENTRGTPNPKRFGVPQRLRERKRAHGVEDRQIETKHGSGREGLNGPENKHRPLRNNNGFTKNRQETAEPKTTTRHRPQQLPRGIHTAGWRGPWAALPSLGESPQGTLVPRGQKTPPPWRDKITGTPKGWSSS